MEQSAGKESAMREDVAPRTPHRCGRITLDRLDREHKRLDHSESRHSIRVPVNSRPSCDVVRRARSKPLSTDACTRSLSRRSSDIRPTPALATPVDGARRHRIAGRSVSKNAVLDSAVKRTKRRKSSSAVKRTEWRSIEDELAQYRGRTSAV